jgi:hypothetical protein
LSYRDFERFDVKVYADEDEGDQEGAASQKMESLSKEAQTKPSGVTECGTSPASPLATIDSVNCEDIWERSASH